MRFFLPKGGLFDTVNADRKVRVRRIYSLTCLHLRTTFYNRIDHRKGPEWASDRYHGVVCVDCGRIIHEVRNH